MDRTERPLVASRRYRCTSPGVTRRYEGVLSSRDVGLRGTPRSFLGLRPKTTVKNRESSREFMAGDCGPSVHWREAGQVR